MCQVGSDKSDTGNNFDPFEPIVKLVHNDSRPPGQGSNTRQSAKQTVLYTWNLSGPFVVELRSYLQALHTDPITSGKR